MSQNIDGLSLLFLKRLHWPNNVPLHIFSLLGPLLLASNSINSESLTLPLHHSFVSLNMVPELDALRAIADQLIQSHPLQVETWDKDISSCLPIAKAHLRAWSTDVFVNSLHTWSYP